MLSYCQAVSQDVPVPGAGVPGGWSRGDQLGRDQLLSPDQLHLRTQACRPGVMSCNQTDAPQLNNSLLFLKAFHYCCKKQYLIHFFCYSYIYLQIMLLHFCDIL